MGQRRRGFATDGRLRLSAAPFGNDLGASECQSHGNGRMTVRAGS